MNFTRSPFTLTVKSGLLAHVWPVPINSAQVLPVLEIIVLIIVTLPLLEPIARVSLLIPFTDIVSWIRESAMKSSPVDHIAPAHFAWFAINVEL